MKNIFKKFVLVLWLGVISLTLVSCKNEQPIDNDEPTTPTDIPSYDFSALFKQEVISRVDGQKKEWNKVSSFITYNGEYDEGLKDYDVAIIKTKWWTGEEVKALTDAGTYLIGYLSIGEDDSIKYNSDGSINDYYFLDSNNKPTVDEDWNSYYVDVRKPSWQNRVIEEVESMIEKGVDGIFMDNMDVIQKYPETKEGMITLVRRLKKNYPTLKLIAKNSFEILPSLASILSGVVYENFLSNYDIDSGKAMMKNNQELLNSYKIAVEQINETRKYNYFPIFALDYANEFEYDYRSQIYHNLSWEFDFIPYTSHDYMLSKVCKTNIVLTASRGVKALETTYQIQSYKEPEISFLPLFQRNIEEKELNTKKNWNDVSSYICYYGAYDDKLTEFDVAIIEGRWWSKDDVKRLSDSGTYVIAYVSIGEDVSITFDNDGNYSDYYIFNEEGKPTQNGVWNSYFVDAKKESWQVKVLDQVKALVDKGVDGIFMDTIDTAVAFEDTFDGMISLIRRIKKEFPHIKLVANRGFELLPYVSSSISGLMYESFSGGYDFRNNLATVKTEEQFQKSVKRAIEVVNEVRKYNYFPVFSLDYVNENEYDYRSKIYYDISWEYDFIPYTTYDILLATPVKPNVVIESQRGSKALG